MNLCVTADVYLLLTPSSVLSVAFALPKKLMLHVSKMQYMHEQ